MSPFLLPPLFFSPFLLPFSSLPFSSLPFSSLPFSSPVRLPARRARPAGGRHLVRRPRCPAVILRPKPAIYLRLKTSHFEGGFPFVCSLPSSNLGGDDDGESAQDGGDSSKYGTSGARLVAAADLS